ncbi:MAG TPA: TonB-dependent receptor [Bacteroidota bacterium]|nr:TonB-dependent receptor [Bacteroidota bacterium]
MSSRPTDRKNDFRRQGASATVVDVRAYEGETLRAILILVAVILFFVNAGPLVGQTMGKVSGTIVDRDTKEPLVGCNVVILGTRLGATTDIDGSFFILNVLPGEYNLEASMIGYQKVMLEEVIVNSGRTTTANFVLTSTTLVQGEVEVVAKRPDVQPEKTSTSEIVRSDDVKMVAGMRDVTDVISLAADVTDGHFRGGRTGEELYTLQGMGIVNPLDATSAFVPILSAVEEVEVSTSGFGAQYGNAQSGVVNITMKEGKSDKWNTSFDARLRLPGRKTFGPSVYDPTANPYLAKLLNINFWLTGDAETSNQPLYSSMGSGLSNRYGGDTAVIQQVAYTLWRMQTKRDLDLSYGKSIDYAVEGGTGGPINDMMRMFVALRSNVVNPEFPTQDPDVDRQLMANVATDFGKGATLLVSGGYSQSFSNVFPSSDGLGFYKWLWDRNLDIEYQNTINAEFGARFSKALSASTFYEVKLNALSTKLNLGSSPWPSALPDSLIIKPENTNTVLTAPVTGPDLFTYLAGNDDFRLEKTLTVSFEASMTSQVTKSHLINGGVQVNGYQIESDDELSTSGTVQTRDYTAKPIEAGFYLQDKMEFEGMIANVGLRLDLWNSNKDYYVNTFDPFAVINDSGKVVRSIASAEYARTPLIGRLQPRAGISFPVSVNTVFHLNYGAYMQRPSFQYIVTTSVQPQYNEPVTLGNPRLEPETTNSYDVGIMQGLGEGMTLDISGYYKDVKNLIEQATFTDVVSAVTYNTYYNRDYADIRGFRATLAKRSGEIAASISYQYSVATGKSATVSEAPPLFRRDSTGTVTTDLGGVPNRDILLDFDRTHNLVITLAYSTPKEFGPMIAEAYPLENFTFSVNAFARSGRPYTSSKDPTNINAARTPAEYNTNIRLTRTFDDLAGVKTSVYAEVFNLFNNKILNYTYLFAATTANQANPNIQPYENYAFNDPQRGVLYWNTSNSARPIAFPVDQSFLIYDNQPRSYNVGVSVEF